MKSKVEHWGVVGGGILGMTLAHRLASQGRRVTLLEGSEQLGGLAGAWQLGPITWDRFYHVILLSDTHTRSLLAELDLVDEVEWVETRTGFYADGRLYSMSNLLEYLSFPPLRLHDKLRLGLTILYAAHLKNPKNLQKQRVADWLTKWSGRPVVDKIWLPLLRAKLGESYRDTSAAFIWATLQRMYAARKSGLKKEMFGYVRGGYARVLDRFGQVLSAEGVTIHLQHSVRDVSALPNGPVTVRFQQVDEKSFDHLILTLPAGAAAGLCEEWTEEERKRLHQVQYLGVICASLLLNKPLSPYYVTNITDSGFPFTGVIEMSALVDQRHFGGHALVYLPKYVRPDDPVFEQADEKIVEQFMPALMKMHPHLAVGDLVAYRIAKEKHVFALPVMDYSRNLPAVRTSMPQVSIINSAHILNGTANINETIALADGLLPQLLETNEALSHCSSHVRS
ncbi:NAD(P)/FAD-dependent oxidoreductase [bacterium]|nr:NAD(P)/FAD-dependent oxidoreductase [bacterium]